jgi:predicted SPOUT superfamily RNA methylase MTH1
LREKTLVAGYIARAAAALRAEGIDVYGPEGPGSDVLLSVLKYLSYPAYLRKIAFPLKPELRYAGVLPPVTIKALNEGFRDREEKLFFKVGLIRSCERGHKAVVEVGEQKPVVVTVDRCRRGALVLVGMDKKGKVVKVLPMRYGVWRGAYVGFEVRFFDSVYDVVKFYKKNSLKVIVTSKMGEWPGRLREFVPGNIGLLFGSPDAGIPEKYPDLEADLVVNTIPCQGVKTVRLEEALWATVGLVSSLEAGLCD